MSSPSQPSERIALVATIDPQNGNNDTKLSDAVDMKLFHEAVFILSAGANDAALDFKLTGASTSGGTYSDITGKAITQETGGNDDDKQWIINLKSEEVGTAQRFVKASVTCANGTTNLISLVALGLKPRYGPANDNDLSSVSQIIT